MKDPTVPEAFFAAHAEQVWAQAPAGTSCLVITADLTVEYFDSFAAAVDAWSTLDGAVIKEYGYQPQYVIASSYRRS